METLASKPFVGKVLLVGPRTSPSLAAIEDHARELGITLLPTLHTPFGEAGLRDSVATLLPDEGPPEPPIHLEEAVREGWLELWYQPEINARSLAIERAEALIRIRHPTWGVVPPAYFIPADGDPHFRALSEYVIDRAIEDWRLLCFATRQGSDRHQSADRLPSEIPVPWWICARRFRTIPLSMD